MSNSTHQANKDLPMAWAAILVTLVIVSVGGWVWLQGSNDAPKLPPLTKSSEEIKSIERHTDIIGSEHNSEPAASPDTDPTDPRSDTSESESARPKIELPRLADSDAPVKAMANQLSPDGKLLGMLVPDSILLKIVRAIIALDENELVKDYRPLESPSSPINVIAISEETDPAIGQRYRLDPKNYQRYTPFIDLLNALDMASLAQNYHDYYPLLEESYQQYGVDRGSFKEVTLRAIDNLLAIEIEEENLVLIQPKVFYQYQDPRVEARSAPHKLLMRMGPDNALALQRQLKELRKHLQP